MKIGINGRIGRLAFQAGLGGLYHPENDPRRFNRLDIVRVMK